MKHLLLVRHGKSSWDDPRLADFDRPLQTRGQSDAGIMAGVVAAQTPDGCVVVSSPARRARDTAAIIAQGLGRDAEAIEYDERIYDADCDDLLAVIRAWDPAWPGVVMVGHNPGLHYLARSLSATDIDKLPTCGLIHLTLDHWPAAAPGAARLIDRDRPKNHR